MKKSISLILAFLLVLMFSLFALGSSETESTTTDQGEENVVTTNIDANLGDYKVEIKGCRLTSAYNDAPVAIVTYTFTNYAKKPTSFYLKFDATAWQNGVGLNKTYILSDSANYNSDNQTKKLKKVHPLMLK